MKVLLVSPRILWPVVDGGQIGIGQHVDQLARAHRLQLMCLHTGDAAALERARQAVPPGLEGMDVVRHRLASPVSSWLLSRGSPWPATLYRYRSAALLDAVRERVRQWQPDVALAEHLHLAYLCASIPEVPWALMAPNLETAFLESLARRKQGLARWLYQAEARRMARMEPMLLASADAIGVVNEREGEWIRQRTAATPIVYAPVGMAAPPNEVAGPRDGFVSVGTLAWLPNRDATEWLVRTIWPRVRERAPTARLTLLGVNTDRVDLAGRDGVSGLGLVEEVKPYLAGARALLVPLRSGAGIRVKILEALSCATPVITTEEGLGDLPATSGEHLLLARTESEFVEAVVQLERDPGRALELGRRGQAWVLREFSLTRFRERLEQLLASAIANARSRAGTAPGPGPRFAGSERP